MRISSIRCNPAFWSGFWSTAKCWGHEGKARSEGIRESSIFAFRSTHQPAHPQKSTSNQSRQGPGARGTIDVRWPQSADGSGDAFCFPPASAKATARPAVIDLVGRNARVELECHARGFIDPELNNGKEAVCVPQRISFRGRSRHQSVRIKRDLRWLTGSARFVSANPVLPRSW